MSLRDWFAGQALAGWLASWPEETAASIIDTAPLMYRMADAMLQARIEGLTS